MLVPNPPPASPVPGAPGTVLALADRWLRERQWDEGFIRRQGHAWIIGGLWKLTHHEGAFRLDQWSFANEAWEAVDLRAGTLTNRSPKASTQVPGLEWTSRLTSEDARDQFLIEACYLVARAAERQQPEGLEDDDFWFVDDQISSRWATPKRARSLSHEFRKFRDELTECFGQPFVEAVKKVRRGKSVDLADLLAAWPYRDALIEAAATHPQLLPLMGHIGFIHWASPGWRHPEGWMQSMATFQVVDTELVTTSPWSQGARWFDTDLPVFLRLRRAKAWLKRPGYAFDKRVWGSREDLKLFELGRARWKAQPWWPSKPPSQLHFLLERLHQELNERLEEPPPPGHVTAMVEGLVDQWFKGRGPKAIEALEDEWDALLSAVEKLGTEPRFERLIELPVTHLWVAQKKQEGFGEAWSKDPQAAPGERIRL